MLNRGHTAPAVRSDPRNEVKTGAETEPGNERVIRLDQRPLFLALLRAFLHPILSEERAAAERAWRRMPDAVKLGDQVLGRASGGCAATYGVIERCNFHCSACYLSDEADHTPPLPFEEIRAQLDRIRAELGPWGNAQITSGEVTLLPVEELVRILRYCQRIQLSPMVMTNGEVLLDDPRYLERLVLEGRLEKIAIHIDTTQRGRRGLKKSHTERDVNATREAFARLIRESRARTGRTLHAAHTFTVTAENVDGVPEVVRWTLANADAFRMLSFQPLADVGRTSARGAEGGRAIVWDKICEGLGVRANARAWHLGHPECSTIALLFSVTIEGQPRVVEVTRAEKSIDRWFFRRLLHGGLAGFSPSGESRLVNAARLLGRIARHPHYLAEIPLYCLYRAWTDRATLARLLSAIVCGRRWFVKPFVLVVHHFMDARELATEIGKQRLSACAFRVPVDGEMISMCELNATGLRRRLNLRDRAAASERVR